MAILNLSGPYSSAKYIRIPVHANRGSFLQEGSTLPTSADSFFGLNIYVPDLQKLVNELLATFTYRSASWHSNQICIIGKKSLAALSKYDESKISFIYIDLSDQLQVNSMGIIFNTDIDGDLILNRPLQFAPPASPRPQEPSIRERMSTSHIQITTDLAAERGRVQTGEYRDGWMACIAFLAKTLGVKVPDGVPFKNIQAPDPNEVLKLTSPKEASEKSER